MLRKCGYVSCLVAVFLLSEPTASQTVEVRLRSNKAAYICGEPVLLKTMLLNPSAEKFIGNAPGYGWGTRVGFTMYIASGEEDFKDILGFQTHLEVMKPPLQLEFFDDRHWLQTTLEGAQQVERVDILAFSEPANYRLKAVLREWDGKVRESKPVEFQILSVQKKPDIASQLGNSDFLESLGSSICFAHYVQDLYGGYGPSGGKTLSKEDFERIAPVIIGEYKASVFREYVMYADILIHYRPETSAHELIRGRKELAERFEREYPSSWLLPDIYRKLFWTYVAENNKAKAEQVRKLVLHFLSSTTMLPFY